MNVDPIISNGEIDRSPTIPLGITCQPALEIEQTAALGRALKASSNPHLQTFGELIEAKALDERMIFLEQMVRREADVRLIEAATKFMGLYHPMMELEKLDLNVPAQAFLAVFHPQAPAHLLESDFTNALQKACTIQISIWRTIAKSALLIMLQAEGGKNALLELANTYSLCGEKLISELLGKMIFWGKMKIKKPPLESFAPAGDCLGIISGPDEKAGLRAALEYLRYYGFIRIADLLD